MKKTGDTRWGHFWTNWLYSVPNRYVRNHGDIRNAKEIILWRRYTLIVSIVIYGKGIPFACQRLTGFFGLLYRRAWIWFYEENGRKKVEARLVRAYLGSAAICFLGFLAQNGRRGYLMSRINVSEDYFSRLCQWRLRLKVPLKYWISIWCNGFHWTYA